MLLAGAASAAPTKVAFANAAGSIGTGVCSPRITVQLQDAAGTPTAAATSTTVALSGPAAVFASAACTGDPFDPALGLVIPPGQTQAQFSFVHPHAEQITLGAAADGFPAATQAWTLTAAAGVPAQLVFTNAPVNVAQGACTPALNYVLEDSAGAAATATRQLTIGLGPSAYVEFYSDAACAQRVLGQTVQNGAAGGTVFVKADAAGTVLMQATSPGLDPATLKLNVAAASSGGCTTAGAVPALSLLLLCLRRRRK